MLLYILLLLFLSIGLWLSIKPSNNHKWSLDQAVLPYARIEDKTVTIHNIRNFNYSSEKDYLPNYYDKSFDISKIKSVDFVLVPFTKWEGPAHAFFTFGFENNEHIAISIEIRKKKGQKFSGLKGLFKAFELMYVIADEKDVIQLRIHHRKNPVYIYPLALPQDKIRSLFVDMLQRANKLKDKPEFYHSLFNACATNMIDHLNKVIEKKIFWSYRLILPGYLDSYLHKIGLIGSGIPREELRFKHFISDKALQLQNSVAFSIEIRK